MNKQPSNMDHTSRINTVEKWGRHKGQHDFLRYLRGERLTRDESIVAHCYNCMGGYSDGAMSCLMDHCPLFPYMPFRNKLSTGHCTTSQGK